MEIEEVIKIWRELTLHQRIEAVHQLNALVESAAIEEELNEENRIISEGINSEPGNERVSTIHSFYCGDFIKPETCNLLSERDLNPHLIFTSPPYNAGIDYGAGFNDKKPTKKYIRFLHEFIDNCDKVLRTGGRLVINLRDITTGKGRRIPAIVPLYDYLCEEKGYRFRGMHIWYKGREESSFAWGSWRSSINPSIIDLYEYVFVFQKGEYLRGPDNLEKTEFIEDVIGVWKIRPVKKITGKNKKNILNHPCPFPFELAKRVIKLYSHVGDIVLDPFAGVLSTSCAAAMSGRNSIAVEINKDYCKYGAERFLGMFGDSLFGNIKLKELRE